MSSVTKAAPYIATSPTEHRAGLWLSLLQRLTQVVPQFGVLKNSARALSGMGDIDAFAAEEDLPLIEQEFRAWTAERDYPLVTVCRHPVAGAIFVAIDPASPYVLFLDIKAYRTFRGSALIGLRDAVSLAELDALGFRRLRPGPEGVLKLLWNGMRRGGRRNEEKLHSRAILELLRSDPADALDSARVVGPAAPLLRYAIRRAIAGEWSRPALIGVEWWCLVRAIGRPDVLLRQIWYRLRVAPQCPVLELSRRARRRLPDDREGWLGEVAAAHTGTSFLSAEGGLPAA